MSLNLSSSHFVTNEREREREASITELYDALRRGFCVRRVIGYYRLLPLWLYSARTCAGLSPLPLLLFLLLCLPTVPTFFSLQRSNNLSRVNFSSSSSSSTSSEVSTMDERREEEKKKKKKKPLPANSATNCVCSRAQDFFFLSRTATLYGVAGVQRRGRASSSFLSSPPRLILVPSISNTRVFCSTNSS